MYLMLLSSVSALVRRSLSSGDRSRDFSTRIFVSTGAGGVRTGSWVFSAGAFAGVSSI